MARSESNAVGNLIFPDLNLTSYPNKIDSRNQADSGYNPNMSGFTNLKDYNLAEHVNALADAVMAIQRILGINPQKDAGGVDRTTVSNRIAIVENRNFDDRYGGPGWDLSQTLVGHTHTGGPGHPSQIDLATEVKNVLSKNHIDLSATTGLTGADILMSPTVSTKISDAIADKLSVSQGGTVQKDVHILGRFSSRLSREWTAENGSEGTLITDVTTLTNKARRASGTGQIRFLMDRVYNLLCGKYVLGVRARVNSQVNENVLKMSFSDFDGTSYVQRSVKYFKGMDFQSAGKWQMFYMVFDHETLEESGQGYLQIEKPATASSVTVDFDHAYIIPVHPAVFDK